MHGINQKCKLTNLNLSEIDLQPVVGRVSSRSENGVRLTHDPVQHSVVVMIRVVESMRMGRCGPPRTRDVDALCSEMGGDYCYFLSI